MSYQVIARKYRPQRFSDVVGQEHVTQTLTRAIEQKRIAHAYIFCGPRGTGKTTIARIFSKCLNATGGPRVDFDDKDPQAQQIAEGRSLDVFEIDGASNNGVEQVRELRETCKYAPASARFKIYIIDEVHMLSTAAFNALLKTLEEPPAHVKFMFATTDPEKVLPTILSRCQRFDLRRIPAALIARHLAEIAKKERVTIEIPALLAIARGAEGALRDAESTLDQLISFCGDRIEEGDVLSMFGLTAQSQLLELSRALLGGEVQSALLQLNQLAENGKDLGRLLSDLLGHFRNLLIFQVSGGALDMLEVSEVEAAALKDQSRMASTEALTRILDVFAEAEARLRDAVSKRILVEITLLKAVEARHAVSLDSVLGQLTRLRDAQPGSTSAAASRKSVRVKTESESSVIMADDTGAVAGSASAMNEPAGIALPNDLVTLWPSLVEAVGRASPFVRSYLSEGHPVSFLNGLLVIGFDSSVEEHISLVDNARNHMLLQGKLAELGHPNSQIKFIKAEAAVPRRVATLEPAPVPAPLPKMATARSTASQTKESLAPIPFNKDDFKDDPLIQKALEIFKAQIVEVRA